MVQVRFVALCDKGHIQDFPWREWVHRVPNPTCKDGALKLLSMGGASLASTVVQCECGVSRTLEQITEADPITASTEEDDENRPEASTYLSKNLAPGHQFLCQGHRPWLGDDTPNPCDRPLRGSLRGATNVHYSTVRSAIYIPRGSDAAPPDLVELLGTAPLKAAIGFFESFGRPADSHNLRDLQSSLLAPYTDQQITAALGIVLSDQPEAGTQPVLGNDSEAKFRRDEFAVLRTAKTEDQLQTCPVSKTKYAPDIAHYLAGVTLAERLRETRVLTGFTRVFPENEQTPEERQAAMWRVPPQRPNRWLPAYVVLGEGIFLDFDEARVSEWETRTKNSIGTRIKMLNDRYREVRERRRTRDRAITPRLVLLHTFAHLLMNQLTFECGYGSASLRERLYISEHSSQDSEPPPMAGILIYTAAGDSEGTMGGLVRMGKPGRLESVIQAALREAQWCSSDPVCMELGASGQGPDSCNLAACHNCSLVPETSCEEFNRFLDRATVVGTIDNPKIGFFSDVIR